MDLRRARERPGGCSGASARGASRGRNLKTPRDIDAPDLERAKLNIERAVGVANFVVGLTLTFGGLALSVYWRVEIGHVSRLRAYYLYTGWAFGTLQILAGTAMRGRWPTRWILQMLPLAVPVLSSQYFLYHFIFRQL